MGKGIKSSPGNFKGMERVIQVMQDDRLKEALAPGFIQIDINIHLGWSDSRAITKRF